MERWWSRRRLQYITRHIARLNKLGIKGRSFRAALLYCAGLFTEHDALNVLGTTCGSVAGDQGSAHLRVALGWLELAGHSGEETCENQLFFNADDRVVWSGHAYVGLVGCASGENALVCRGNVGVGTEQSGDATVEVPPKGYLFAGGFAMEVEENDLCGDLAEKLVGLAKGVVATRHEDAALEVHDGIALAVAEFALVDSEAGSADRVVGWAQDASATDV